MTSCETCEEGSISSEGESSCTPCSIGHQANLDNTQCVPCESGSYKDTSMITCRQCPTNTYSAASAGLCTPCPRQTLANKDRTKCVSCEGLPSSWKDVKTDTQFPVPPGDEVSLKCSPGHTLTGVSTVTCEEGTTFSPADPPSCILDTCSALPPIKNLTTTTEFPVSYSTRVTVQCDVGFSLKGGDVITCIKDNEYQSFHDQLPSCEEKTCSDLPTDIANLKTDMSFPVSYGTVVPVSCSEDGKLRGDNVITCNQDTDFKFQIEPRCNDIGTCMKLPTAKHLKTDSTFPVKKGTAFSVDCMEGFAFTSGDRTITCVQDSEYTSSKEQPTCIIEKCTALSDSLSFGLKTVTSLPVDHGTLVEVDCISGYSLSGSRLITCIRDRNWKYEEVPDCILDTCTELPAAMSDMTTVSTFPVIVGTVVEVNCKPGHTLAGDNSITCIKDVSFTIGQRPICTIDQCTGMMTENNLSTNATYPITYGTAITVACDPEYKLMGSEVITCEKGIVYSHKSIRPKCVDPDLGQYDNIATGAIVEDSNGKDGAKTVATIPVTYGSIIDGNYESGYTFDTAQNKITLVVTFKSPKDGEDSYGINKLFIFSKLNIESVSGWKVYFKSIPRNGAEWPCQRDTATGLAVESKGERTDKYDGWEAEVVCGPNTQAKNMILKHDNADGLALHELRVAGLPSSKYDCDLGWRPGTQTCSRCPPGQKGVMPESEEGEPQCQNCPAGWFSDYLDEFEPILECTKCTAGKYSEAGASSCTPCAPGTYQDEHGQSTCKICQAGTFQELEGKTGFDECEAGFFSKEKSSECTACPVGTKAENTGSAKCDPCSKGEYQKDRGQSICLGCQAGTFSKDEGADTCTPCPKGEYNSQTKQSACTPCQAGKYQSAEGQTKCIDCNVGTFNNQPRQDSCQPCPLGEYLGNSGQTSCYKCNPGYYQDVVGSIDCKPCPPLKYQDQMGASQCIHCPKGEISLEGATVCTPCQAGTRLDQDTKTCVECLRGTYSADRAISCIQCDIMFYQPDRGRDKCLPCEAGTITAEKGSVGCQKCERGTYRSASMTEPVCQPCPAGSYSNQQGLAECTPCPTGTYSKGQSIECDKCGKGKFQSKTGQETCEECPPGSYSDTEGLNECVQCKVDTVSSESGSTSCVACSYGFYSPDEGGTVCQTCPKRAAYQPPSCPPIIPNCPRLEFSNQYGNFSFPEYEPPDEGSFEYKENQCAFALYVDDEKVFSNITSECRTWFENGEQKSNWTTPSYAKCGTIQTEIIYNETKAARDAIKAAESAGKGLEDAVVDEAVAESMLSNLMGAIGTTPAEPDPDPDGSDNTDGSDNSPDPTDPKDSEENNESNLGAADTANVVKTLAVVANSVPPAVLADPANQKNILGAINDFAEQDDDFVQDAGTDTASAAVNVVESIGASMFTAPGQGSANPSPGGNTTQGNETEPEQNEIKTETMTIRVVPTPKDTESAGVMLDFGEEEEEDTTSEDDDSEAAGAKQEEPEEQALPATEAPVIPDPVQSEDKEPAPTAAPVLQVVRATKPPPVKKIVKVQMPPMGNLDKASKAGGGTEEAAGLVCVVFETPALFPTNKTAEKLKAAKKTTRNAAATPEPKVASKVVLLSYGSKPIHNIDPPLALNFTKDEPEDYDPQKQDVSYKCVYYDTEKKTWETDGCFTTSVDKTRGGKVSCECNHMTSFAILMSLEPIPDYLEVIQSQITNPLLSLSLFFLLLMIGTIIPFKSLRSTRSMKIHLSLAGSQCFAIVVFLLTNLGGLISEDVPELCIAIAILMDYSYLVVFMWTVVESVIMYISLVQVFGGHISKYMLKFNLFCWITPLLSPLTSYFLTEGILLDEGKCVIDQDVRKFSFILPIGVVLGINFFIFVTLLKVIANTTNPEKSKTENTLKQLKAVASISCMLGLGWMLGFFMTGPIAPYFQFVFIIVNGIQGILMFLFYCVGNEQYMDLWKRKLGIKVKTSTSTSSSAAGRPSCVSTVARPSTVQGPSAVVQATPAPATLKPNPVVTVVPCSAPRNNGFVSRHVAKIEEEAKKLDKTETESLGSAIYENENVYDIIDDPDIQARSPATITRI